MIITTLKPIDEITKALHGVKRIFLLGCGDCATICATGSEEVLLEKKKEFEAKGITVSGAAVAEVGCNAASVRICFAQQRKEIKDAEAFVVFSCGLGVQQAGLSAREPKKIIAACNTHSVGIVTTQDQAEQLCSLCGDCNLSETKALCLKTLCPKEMSNGPCGGVSNGKCEVFPEYECVWVTLYQRTSAQERAMFEQITLPRDFSKRKHPQKITLKK